MPTLSGLSTSVTFAENTVNATPQPLDAEVTFASTGPLDGGRLLVRGLLAEDRISILSLGTDPGQISLAGTTVSFGGVAFGTILPATVTNPVNTADMTVPGGQGAPLTVAFNAAATAEAVDALIQSLTYTNVSDTPTATRTLTINVVDKAGAGLAPASFTELTGTANPFAGITLPSSSKPAFGDLDYDGRLDLVLGGDTDLRAWRNTGTGYVELTGADNPVDGFFAVFGAPSPTFEKQGRSTSIWVGTFGGVVVTRPVPGDDSEQGSIEFRGASSLMPDVVDLPGFGRVLVLGTAGSGLLTYDLTTPSKVINPFAGVDAGTNIAPAFVDLDDDGRPDLVAGNSEGTLRAWRNTATGFVELTGAANPFAGIQLGTANIVGDGGSAPTFVDLNGDGRLDLVAGGGSGTVRAWLNTTPLPAITVTVTAQNDAPVITSGGVSFTAENRPATEVIHRALATDGEGSVITWSLAGADAALFTLDATGALRFKAAPDFETRADANQDGRYDLELRASDGIATTTRDLAVTVTDMPEHRLSGLTDAVTFGENAVNAGPRLLDADVAFTTGGGSLAGGRLVVSGLLAEDRVSVLAQGDGAGQIGLAGTTLRYGGQAFGTVAGGVGGDLTVTFTAAATGAAVDALIQRLAYANASDTPTATRSLTIEVTDAAGRGLTTPAPGSYTALTGVANPFTGIDIGFAATPAFGDVDGDGRVDLVLGGTSASGGLGNLQFWRNTGTGFAEVTGAGNPFGGISVRATYQKPALVDFDGDGDLDLTLGAIEQVGLRAFRNTGGVFTELGITRTTRVGTISDNPFFVVEGSTLPNAADPSFPFRLKDCAPSFVDLDADGLLDLVVGTNRGIQAFRNTGTGYVWLTGDANPFAAIAPGIDLRPAFTDLDSDGRPDLVLGLNAADLGAAPIPYDSDNDGILDDFTNPLRPPTVYRNTATGFVQLTGDANPFAAIQPGFGLAPAFADLDLDGRIDLVLGDLFGTLHAFRNTPPPVTITVTVTPEAESSLLSGGTGNDTRIGGSGADTLLGLGGADTLQGAGGNDSLDGGTGADSLLGGEGRDTLIGNDGWDTLSGGGGNDSLSGGIGNDSLDGGDGFDTLDGGLGNDIYILGTGDTVTGGEATNGGVDSVFSSRPSTTLAINVENLTLTGPALNGIGNASNNRITGTTGANSLAGMSGNDTLSAGAGADTVDGGEGGDSLAGGFGSDVLIGGAGADSLSGGRGADVFRFGSPAQDGDVILDYAAVDDVIQVSLAGFGAGLALGTLPGAAFGLGALGVATTTAQRFIWDGTAKALWFDPTGSANGATDAVKLATFIGAVTLAAGEIQVIA